MSIPLVSIIIPCYNAEKYVAEAIQSALDQTYLNCEVIVIDDGSTDGSLEIIKSFGDKIRLETGPNRGGNVARNCGTEISRGEYLQFLDADDILTPRKIERQIEELRKNPGSISYCPWSYFDEHGIEEIADKIFWKSYENGYELIIDMYLIGGFISPNCFIFPKDLVVSVGGWNEELIADQDGEFTARVILEASTIIFVPDVTAHYRRHGKDNVSQNVKAAAWQSRIKAMEIVAGKLYEKTNRQLAKAAVANRMLSTAYFMSKCDYGFSGRNAFRYAKQALLHHKGLENSYLAGMQFRIGTLLFGAANAVLLLSWKSFIIRKIIPKNH